MTPEKLLKALPKTIRVGPFDFGLVVVSRDLATSNGRWGCFHSTAQIIELQDAFPNPQKAVDTLVHEINHALFWAYGLEDEDKEERTVATFATGWTQIYRDNPWLIEWIKKAFK